MKKILTNKKKIILNLFVRRVRCLKVLRRHDNVENFLVVAGRTRLVYLRDKKKQKTRKQINIW